MSVSVSLSTDPILFPFPLSMCGCTVECIRNLIRVDYVGWRRSVRLTHNTNKNQSAQLSNTVTRFKITTPAAICALMKCAGCQIYGNH